MKENKKIFLWILVPLIYGFLSTSFGIIIPPLLSQVVFAVLWFWIGLISSRISGNNIKNFIIGNSIWLVSFLLYLWKFLLLNDESRNMFLAIISQNYMHSFIWSGREVTLLFSDVLHGTTITIISYLSMLLVFSLGFLTGKLQSR